jgi:hypothetical protein
MADAKTWDDLAAILGHDAREFRRWRKDSSAPQTPDVTAWQAWLSSHTRGGAGPATPVATDAALPGECAYDALVQAGKISYEVAKERESVIGISIKNEAAKIDNLKARGELVPKESADRAAALVRDSITQKYERSIARALGRLANVSAELRGEIMAALQVELDAE